MSAHLMVFLESNATGTGLLFFERTQRLGLQPVLLAADPARYPFLASYQNIKVGACPRRVRPQQGTLKESGRSLSGGFEARPQGPARFSAVSIHPMAPIPRRSMMIRRASHILLHALVERMQT
jgi:hypothetical protein